jgi:hypothetical protein
MSKRRQTRVPATGVYLRCSFFAFKSPPFTWWEEHGVIHCEECHQPVEYEFGWRTPHISKTDFNWLIPTGAKCACQSGIRLKEIPEKKRRPRNNPRQALFSFHRDTDNPDRNLDL